MLVGMVRRAALLLLLSGACASSPPAPPRAPDPAPARLPELPPPEHPDREPLAVAAPALPALTPPDRVLHERAAAALAAGRIYEARRIVAHLYAAYPGDAALLDEYQRIDDLVARAQQASIDSMNAAALRALPAPPYVYTLVRPAGPAAAKPPRLTKRSEKPNHITDDDAWFTANQIHLPEYFVPSPGDILFAPGVRAAAAVTIGSFTYAELAVSPSFAPDPLPLAVPLRYGSFPLVRAVDCGAQVVAIYRSDGAAQVVAVLERATGHVDGLFDLAAFAHPPSNVRGSVPVGSFRIAELGSGRVVEGTIAAPTDTVTLDLVFATVQGGVLYLEHAYNGYTKEARGQTGYVTAIDVATGDLLWRSAPVVANSRNLLVDHGFVFAGYGFTAEPHFLYVLDAATGATVVKQPVRKSIDWVVARGDTLFVRTYDTDYAFEVAW
jgi:hypothetical protein